MRKLLAFTFALGMVAAIQARAAEPYVIGIIAPTTGPVATVGQRQLDTVQWWQEKVNKAGGINGHKIELVHCNDEANPEKAVTCARDLIDKGSVILLNSSITGPIMATLPLVAKGPVMITPSPNVIPDPSTYVFQTAPSDLSITKAVAAFLKKNSVDKLAMIAATDSSGEVGVHSANEVFPAAGIELKLARIDVKAHDATVQLAQIMGPDVRVLYSSYSGGGAVAVVKSYKNLGLDRPLIVSYANISDLFLKVIRNDMPPRLLGTALKALVPDTLGNDDKEARAKTYFKEFADWKGEQVDQLNIVAFALVDTVEAVLRNVSDPSDPDAVKAYLEASPVDSIQDLTFSSKSHVGLGEDDMTIVEYKDGHWEPADPIE